MKNEAWTISKRTKSTVLSTAILTNELKLLYLRKISMGARKIFMKGEATTSGSSFGVWYIDVHRNSVLYFGE